MHLVYYDEAGDDGYPIWASPLFVLSAVYCPALDWRENFDFIAGFKKQLAKDFNFPLKLEIHTRELLLNKKPYSPLRLVPTPHNAERRSPCRKRRSGFHHLPPMRELSGSSRNWHSHQVVSRDLSSKTILQKPASLFNAANEWFSDMMNGNRTKKGAARGMMPRERKRSEPH